MTNLTDDAMGELRNIAKEHPSFESFLQECQRLADHVWHDVRTAGDSADQRLDEGVVDVDTEIYGDTEPAKPPENETVATAAGSSTPGAPSTVSSSDTRSSAELTGHPDTAQ
jgi:hypothetical protein